MAYQAHSNEVLLFGGVSDTGRMSDTWALRRVAPTGMALAPSTVGLDVSQLTQVNATAVVKTRNHWVNHLNILSVPKTNITTTPGQRMREQDGDWEILSQTITNPTQLMKLSFGNNGFFRAQVVQKPLGSGLQNPSIALDYFEMRFRYDLDHHDTQIEPTCGDGVIQPWLGEACDDLNTVDGDYCSADCTQELAWCGDGDTQANAGEVCDGDTDDYWCSSDCWFKLDKDGDEEGLDGGVAEGADGGL